MGAVEKMSGNPESTKLRVCHIISGDLWAGAECQVVHLLSELLKSETICLSAVTFNSGRLTDELNTLGVRVTCMPEKEMSAIQLTTGIREHLIQQGVNLIHCHGHKEHILGCIAGMSVKRRVRVVRTLHGMPEPFDGLAKARLIFFHCVQEFFLRHRTDKVIAVSYDMQRRLSGKAWSDKIVCIHNGVEPNRIKPTVPRDEMRQRLGIGANDFVIGTACRLVPIKRLDLLLEAFQMLQREHPDSLLLISGDGPLRQDLEKKASSLGIVHKVRFLGHRDDIYNVITTFDIFAMTSEHEGVPMVLLEASHLGIPIVATNVGGIGEIITDNHFHALIDGLSGVSISDALSQKFRQLRDSAADLKISRFPKQGISVNRTAVKTIALYQSILQDTVSCLVS
ncbi:MAG: hypothetical protein Kow0099_26630 [Candidatus Abyssubacteria bacterium]